MASSLMSAKVTWVSRAAATVAPVALSIRHWPVNTLWVEPDRVASMATASAASRGLPKRTSPCTTTVSAPRIRPAAPPFFRQAS